MEKSERGETQQEANSSIKNEKENTEIQEESSTSSGNENQNEQSEYEIQEESSTSSGNENQNEQSEIDIEIMLRLLALIVPDKNKCRIYKVPYHLRIWNEDAYTPHVISIGPYHHNKEIFQTMEEHKVRYFNSFVQRAEKEINLESLETTIRGIEGIIRHCYVDTVQLERNDFVKMIALDATFILELFLKIEWGELTRADPIFVEGWLFSMLKRELLLLENQLPFFVIKRLYHLAFPSLSKSLPLIQLTFHFFKSLNILDKAPEGEINHFTDLLRFFALPQRDMLPRRGRNQVYPKYSASQLREAGVKFNMVSNKCVLDLNFKKGVLEIPLLQFRDSTEAYVRNIMALEQCDYRSDRYFTDFYVILDRLVNTDKDVDLLSDKGIIVNDLGDSNVITSMINKLNRGIFTSDMNSKYCQVCEDLNKFYEKPWHRWKALLRHQYFNTPWRVASTIAAIILLVLTLIQTVCSIIQIL